jgi:hypothetical protein
MWGWVGPRAGLDAVVKKKKSGHLLRPQHAIILPIAQRCTAELSWLLEAVLTFIKVLSELLCRGTEENNVLVSVVAFGIRSRDLLHESWMVYRGDCSVSALLMTEPLILFHVRGFQYFDQNNLTTLSRLPCHLTLLSSLSSAVNILSAKE